MSVLQGTGDTASANPEWRQGWPLVVAASAGNGLTALMIFTMGLFIVPLETEFGWSRMLITSGLTVNAVIGVTFAAFVGALIDRIGPRRIAIPGVALFCLAFGALATVGGGRFHWWALWLLVAGGALMTKPTVWTAAVASRFSAARGLALALVLSGASVSGVLAPAVGGYLIETHGWRWGYVGLAVIWFAVAMPLVLLFFYGASDQDRTRRTADKARPPAAPLAGLGFREALRSGAFIKLALATVLIVFTLTAGVIHYVPVVSAGGLPRASAVAMASVIGFASIVGRLGTGWLLDRFNGARIGGVVFALPAIAFGAMLAFDGGAPLAVLIAFLLGSCSGAGLAVCSYLASRYFGMRNFGALFGLIIGLLSLATGLGPMVAGYVHDRFASYDPALWTALPLCLVASLLIFTLGPYPQLAAKPEPARG